MKSSRISEGGCRWKRLGVLFTLLAGLCSPVSGVEVNSFNDLQDALRTEQSEGISLGGDLSGQGELTIGGSNTLDLKEFDLNFGNEENLSQTALKFSDGTIALTVTSSADESQEDVFKGSIESFGELAFLGSAAAGSSSTLILKDGVELFTMMEESWGGYTLIIEDTLLRVEGSRITAGQEGGEDEDGTVYPDYKGNVLLKGDLELVQESTFWAKDALTVGTGGTILVDASKMTVGSLVLEDGVTTTLKLGNGGTFHTGGNLTLDGESILLETVENATLGGGLSVGGTLTLQQSLTVGGTETHVLPLAGLSAEKLVLNATSFTDDTDLEFHVTDGKAVTVGELDATTGNVDLLVTGADSLLGVYASAGTDAPGKAVFGKADATGGNLQIRIEDGGGWQILGYEDENGNIVGGNLEIYLRENDSMVVSGTRYSTTQYNVAVSNDATIHAVEGSNQIDILSGALVRIEGTLSTGAAAGETLAWFIDGEGESPISETETMVLPSALVVGTLNANTEGTAEFVIRNGGVLNLLEDNTLGEGVKIVLGGAGEESELSMLLAQNYGDSGLVEVNLTLNEGLVLENAQDDSGETMDGGRIVVTNGTLTVNMNELTVAEGTNSPVNEISATKLQLADAADSDVTFTVTDGKAVQVGEITGAQTAGSAATIQVSQGSTLGAYIDSTNTSWTGNVTLGAADGGDVNISLTEGSSFVAGNAMTIHLQDGNAITVDGTIQKTTTGDDGEETTTVPSQLSAETLALHTYGASSLDITNGGQVYGTSDVTLTAADNAQWMVEIAGTQDADGKTVPSYLASNGTISLGGDGTINMTLTNGGAISAGELLAATGSGETTITMSGKASFLELFKSDGTDSSGDLILGKSGTATLNVSDGAVIEAAGKLVVGESGVGTMTLENSVLQSAGVIIGQNAEANGSKLTVSGSGSQWYITEQAFETPTIAGTGTLEVKDLINTTGEGDWSGVYVNAGTGIYLNGNATFDNSYLYFATSSETSGETTTTKNSYLSVGQGNTVQIENGSILSGNPIITGNIVFDGTSTYEAALGTDGSSEKLTVHEGNITITDGAKLNLYFADQGFLQTMEWTVMEIDETYDIIGEWDISSPLPFYSFTQDGGTVSAELNDHYFQDRLPGGNPNEQEVVRFLDSFQDSWYSALMNLASGTDEELRAAVRQLTGSARANSMQLARQSLWVPVGDRISWDQANQAYLGPQNPFSHTREYTSLWFQAGYRYRSLDGNGGLPGYDIDGFNVMVGMDRVFESYLAGGLFFSYSNPQLEQDWDSVEASNYSFGLYLGYKMGWGLELKGMAAYTFSDYDLQRNMHFFFGENYLSTASYKGDAVTASIELARPIFFPMMVLRPMVAVDTEAVWQKSVMESGAGIYSLYYGDSDGAWTYARLGLTLDLASMERFVLKGKAFYALQIDGTRGSRVEGIFSSTNYSLSFVGTDPGDDYWNLGLTGQFTLGPGKRTLLYVTYDGYFNGDLQSHFIDGGLQFTF